MISPIVLGSKLSLTRIQSCNVRYSNADPLPLQAPRMHELGWLRDGLALLRLHEEIPAFSIAPLHLDFSLLGGELLLSAACNRRFAGCVPFVFGIIGST